MKSSNAVRSGLLSILALFWLGACADGTDSVAVNNNRLKATELPEAPLKFFIQVPKPTFLLGEPATWSLLVENQSDDVLKVGLLLHIPTCDILHYMAGVDYSLFYEDGKELVTTPVLPYLEDGLPGTQLDAGERRELTCDLTEVYRLDRIGKYRLEVSARIYYAIEAADRLPATLYQTKTQSVTGRFEIRQLSAEALRDWRTKAGGGDITAIRILGGHRDPEGLIELERAISFGDIGVRRETVKALLRVSGIEATDVLGRAMLREQDPSLKEQIANSMVEERKGLGAEPWVRALAQDKVVFHEFDRDGRTYRHYRLRRLARDFLAGSAEPIDHMSIEEPVRN